LKDLKEQFHVYPNIVQLVQVDFNKVKFNSHLFVLLHFKKRF